MNEIVYKSLSIYISLLVRYSLLSAVSLCVGLRYGSCIVNSVFLASALCTEKAYGVIPLCRGGELLDVRTDMILWASGFGYIDSPRTV